MVAIIMALFCHEKLTMHTILCILLAAGGILLLYNTGDGGTLIVIASALSYAIYLVAINNKLLAGIATLAVFPTVISLVCTTRAIQIIGSTPTAILGALEPVTAVIMGIILFDEGMTAREGFGMAMILVAVSFVVAGGAYSGNSITRHLTRFRQMFPKLGK